MSVWRRKSRVSERQETLFEKQGLCLDLEALLSLYQELQWFRMNIALE
jgi:hypothetical protein